MQFIAFHDNSKPVSANRKILGPMARSIRVQKRQEKQLSMEAALAKTGRRELKRIQVKVTDSAVLLRGFVSSFFLKQLAQESVRSLATGSRIDNQIRVTAQFPQSNPVSPASISREISPSTD